MKTSLNEMLTYQNKHIIKRYQKDYGNNTLSADAALQEVIKYLWISEKHRHDKQSNPNDPSLDFECAIHFEMKEIDDMWHTFILFTQEYADFCQQYFDHFMHHAPNVSETKPTQKKFTKPFKNYLSYVYDHLGENTLRTWFHSLLTA